MCICWNGSRCSRAQVCGTSPRQVQALSLACGHLGVERGRTSSMQWSWRSDKEALSPCFGYDQAPPCSYVFWRSSWWKLKRKVLQWFIWQLGVMCYTSPSCLRWQKMLRPQSHSHSDVGLIWKTGRIILTYWPVPCILPASDCTLASWQSKMLQPSSQNCVNCVRCSVWLGRFKSEMHFLSKLLWTRISNFTNVSLI